MAAASPSVDDLTAKIIDRVATLNPEKLHDGAFRKELLDFRDEGIRRGQSVNLGNGVGIGVSPRIALSPRGFESGQVWGEALPIWTRF